MSSLSRGREILENLLTRHTRRQAIQIENHKSKTENWLWHAPARFPAARTPDRHGRDRAVGCSAPARACSRQAEGILGPLCRQPGQLRIAWELYLQDDHFYPLATSGGGLDSWHRALRPYASDQVFFCPQEIPATTDWLALFPSPAAIHPHYGYNFVGAARLRHPPALNPGLGGDFILSGAKGEYRPAPESGVIAPARMIALGDSPAFIRPPSSAMPTLTRLDPLYITFPFNFPAWGYAGVGNWHDGGANMLFCDGHVEFATQSLWMQPSGTRRRLWSSDNQPHEESW